MKNIFKKKILRKLFLLCIFSTFLFSSCSNGGDDGPATDTYSGSFTVNGANYSSLSITNGSYTLTGSGTSDSGSYGSSASVLADGLFTFTSNTHNGTFKVNKSGNSISFSNGTLTASGSGTLVVPVAGGGTVLFEGGFIEMTADSSNPSSTYPRPTSGTATYRFTARTLNNYDRTADYTSKCGAYRWYLGGAEVVSPVSYEEGMPRENWRYYSEITVEGVTVTPSSDSRSCTVTIDYSQVPSGTNSVRLVVVDWSTPLPGRTEMNEQNYMTDQYLDDQWTAISLPDVRYSWCRSDEKTISF